MTLWRAAPQSLWTSELVEPSSSRQVLLAALAVAWGDLVSLTAEGLPPGTRLALSGGVWTIAGVPLESGDYSVVLTAKKVGEPTSPGETQKLRYRVEPFVPPTVSALRNDWVAEPSGEVVPWKADVTGSWGEAADLIDIHWIVTELPGAPTTAQVAAGLGPDGRQALYSGRGNGPEYQQGQWQVRMPSVPNGVAARPTMIWLVMGYRGNYSLPVGATHNHRVMTEAEYSNPNHPVWLARKHTNKNIVACYLSGDRDGEKLAEAYAAARGIPDTNIIECPHPTHWNKYQRLIGADTPALVQAILDGIDASPHAIRGVQLLGDWPVATSYWRTVSAFSNPTGKAGAFPVPFGPMLAFARACLEHCPEGYRGDLPDHWPNVIPRAFWEGALWELDPNSYAFYHGPRDLLYPGAKPARYVAAGNISQTIRRGYIGIYPGDPERQLEVLTTAVMPCFALPAEELALPWLQRILQAEGAYTDFGTVILTDSTTSPSVAAGALLDDMTAVGYPTEEVYYRAQTLSGSRLCEGDEARHRVAGAPGYIDTPGVGLRIAGDIGSYHTTYWRPGCRPARAGDQQLRPGAIAVYSQSFPFEYGNALVMHWHYVVHLIRVGAEVSTIERDQPALQLTIPEFRGVSHWYLYLQCQSGATSAECVVLTPTEFELRENGARVYHANIEDTPVQVWFDALAEWCSANGWVYDWGRPRGPTSRGFEAIMAGAALAFGSAAEPMAGNDGGHQGLVTSLWARGRNLSELIWQRRARGHAHHTMDYYGDLLFTPFPIREPPAGDAQPPQTRVCIQLVDRNGHPVGEQTGLTAVVRASQLSKGVLLTDFDASVSEAGILELRGEFGAPGTVVSVTVADSAGRPMLFHPSCRVEAA